MINLEAIVKDWAWTKFQLGRGICATKYKLEDIIFEIKWNRVEFISDKPEYRFLGEERSTFVLFKSTYENRTSLVQENWFTCERSTTSTCTTKVEEGFTFGKYAQLKLTALNEILKISTGFGDAVQMNKSSEETHERCLTWKTKSSVKVKEKHRARVSLKVAETSRSGEFTMNVRIKGWILVVIRSKKDNTFLTTIETDIFEVMEDNFETEANKVILCNMKGKCQFCYVIEQRMQIEETEIKDGETKEGDTKEVEIGEREKK